MKSLTPTYSVTALPDNREVHFAMSGLFDIETLDRFTADLSAAGMPLVKSGGPIRVFGDLTGFVAQTRPVAQRIEKIVHESRKLGVERTAIITDTKLTALQYRRVNEGITVEIFDNKADAIFWLRNEVVA
ncbi:hypothetical protein CD351_12220 [Erythrobacter sp. KY5]|uniref:STAS/SEC14 domain-containing protein n=1 Tax=Erythrobacter sp. KY5 TaxID=2011159 RepID=UPI000DBF146A|nr:STAS/SEC14 domain-containing protein [Erythrobacter sp. KY5]AWW75194.1 hypothetical protein CD351_12220 [Erythrobacter sp. KY5]